MSIKSTLIGLALSTPMVAQELALLEGPSLTNLDVRLIQESQLATGGGTFLLRGIEVMPIEITGRRASQDLEPALPHLATRNDILRVEVPGIGRVIAYRRQGGAFWGYLLVPTMGGARVLVELPGTGAAGTNSPFADRIAIAEDGIHAVIPRFGGATLHIVRLDGGVLGNGQTSRTVTIPGGADNTGLMVGSTVGFATANDRIFRFNLAAGNAVDLTPTVAITNPRLKPEIAMSGDGNTIAFLYGATNLTLQIYLATATGPASIQMPPPPSKYEEPGYLPEGTGDIRLMLNEDGSRLFYIETGGGGTGHGGDESFLLDTTGTLPTLQVTADEHFQPYIGIHVLPSFKGTSLMAAIGDINLMDWYKADLTVTGGTITNLTATGSTQQPFPAGTLVPGNIKVIGQTAFATDVGATSQTLRTIDLNAGSSQVLFQDLPQSPALGSSLFGSPDLFVPGAGDRIYSGFTGNLIGATPTGLHMSPPLSTPYFGVTSIEIVPNWRLIGFYFAAGGVYLGPYVENLDQMVLTPGGGMLISTSGATSVLLYLSLGNPFLNVPIAHQGVRVFLSGANG